MTKRYALRLAASWLAVVLLFQSWADAASSKTSTAGNAKARAATGRVMNSDYARKRFAEAEAALLEIVKNCQGNCSPGVLAQAWMSVGIVRTHGTRDALGAFDAFRQAAQLDRKVRLDSKRAQKEGRALFSYALRSVTGKLPVQARAWKVSEDYLLCGSPAGEVQTRRPVPIECVGPSSDQRVMIKFKAPGEVWERASASLDSSSGRWQGLVPCTKTQKRGGLEWYGQVLDVDGNVLAEFGGEQAVKSLQLVEKTQAAPPAFRGQEAAARCAPAASLGAPGVWGASCAQDAECSQPLLCLSGSCESPNACDSDSDCASRSCEDGVCQRLGSRRKRPSHWIGIAGAWDFVNVGGSNVCSGGESNFDCSLAGANYTAVPSVAEPRGGGVNSGIVPGTARALLTYEYLLPWASQRFGLEGQVGTALFATTGGRVGFTPLHLAVGLKYYLANSFLGSSALRPFVSVGGGLGGSSRDLEVVTSDCGYLNVNNPNLPAVPDPAAFVAQAQAECINTPATAANRPLSLTPTSSERLGPLFAGAGVGLFYALTSTTGPVARVDGALFLSGEGFAIRPTLGYVVGF